MLITRMLIIISVVAACGSASAQDIVSVDRGEPAPFSGQLFPQDTALNWAKEIELCDIKLELHKKQREDIRKAYTQSYENRVEVIRGSYEERIYALRQDNRKQSKQYVERIASLEDVAFYEDPLFTFSVGLALGILGSGAAALSL